MHAHENPHHLDEYLRVIHAALSGNSSNKALRTAETLVGRPIKCATLRFFSLFYLLFSCFFLVFFFCFVFSVLFFLIFLLNNFGSAAITPIFWEIAS